MTTAKDLKDLTKRVQEFDSNLRLSIGEDGPQLMRKNGRVLELVYEARSQPQAAAWLEGFGAGLAHALGVEWASSPSPAEAEAED